MDLQSSKATKAEEPVVPPLKLSADEPPMSSTLVEDPSADVHGRRRLPGH